MKNLLLQLSWISNSLLFESCNFTLFQIIPIDVGIKILDYHLYIDFPYFLKFLMTIRCRLIAYSFLIGRHRIDVR